MKKVDSLIKNQKSTDICQNYSNVIKKLIDEQTKKEEKLKKENHGIEMALYDYAKMLIDYSRFHRNTMSQIILDLAELYNGEEYKYQEVNVINDENESEIVLLFCPKSYNVEFLDLKYSKLILNKKFIILRRALRNMCFVFYYTDRSNNMFSTYNIYADESLKHSFLKDFVDYVINYRIKNNLNNFFPLDLKKAEQEFIISRKEEIERINKTLNEDEQRILDDKVNIRNLRLNSFIGLVNKSANNESTVKKVLEPKKEVK